MERPQGDLSAPLTLNGDENAAAFQSSMEIDAEHPRLVDGSTNDLKKERVERTRTHEEYANVSWLIKKYTRTHTRTRRVCPYKYIAKYKAPPLFVYN